MMLPLFCSCSTEPPAYSEIEERFKELVEASAEINTIFFGEGLPTYERVYDPLETLETADVDGEIYYYYEISDKELGRVIAYRKNGVYPIAYLYARVVSTAEPSAVEVYKSENGKLFAYALENYTEPEYELFYDDDDPKYYDYVRNDAKYTSIDAIKAAAKNVYSEGYLNSIYSSMFDGISSPDGSLVASARYKMFSDEGGDVRLMKSNTFKPYISETRVYDFSTAKIGEESNGEFVYIEIESYMPSNPENRYKGEISLIYENGNWFLDSPTY